MARPYRIEAENTLYHITSRGNGRKEIYSSDGDYRQFLEYLLRAKKRYKFYLYAYVLMTNHYHLLIETLNPNISKIMHYINSAYTTYYNTTLKQTGHLFQGRYKSLVVDKDNYFLELTRYIHLNPVRAGMVEFPEEYKWCSYRGYLREKDDEYIDKDEIKRMVNLKGKEYRGFVNLGIGIDENILDKIYGGIILGEPNFIKKELKRIKEPLENSEITYKRELNRKITKNDVLNVIEDVYGYNKEELNKRKRDTKIRKIAIYLMRKLTGLTNKEIGNIFGMNFSAVSKAAIGIEKEIRESKKVKKEIAKLISNFEG